MANGRAKGLSPDVVALIESKLSELPQYEQPEISVGDFLKHNSATIRGLVRKKWPVNELVEIIRSNAGIRISRESLTKQIRRIVSPVKHGGAEVKTDDAGRDGGSSRSPKKAKTDAVSGGSKEVSRKNPVADAGEPVSSIASSGFRKREY